MSFNFNFNSNNFSGNKSSFRTLVQQKQQFFKRLQRRYNSTTNASERTFLKNEANRVVSELKNFASQWKKNGFGNNTWVTRGYNTSNFSFSNNNNYKSNKNRTKSTRRSSSRRTSSSNKYRSYVAW